MLHFLCGDSQSVFLQTICNTIYYAKQQNCISASGHLRLTKSILTIVLKYLTSVLN